MPEQALTEIGLPVRCNLQDIAAGARNAGTSGLQSPRRQASPLAARSAKLAPSSVHIISVSISYEKMK